MTAEEIKVLGDSEMETGQRMAIALGIVSVAFLLIIGGLVFTTVPNLLAWVFLLAVGFGSAAVTAAMLWAWRRRNDIIATFMRYKLPAPLPAPAAIPAPALPETKEAETPIAKEPVGEVFTSRPLHGLPVLTVEYMCNFLGNKNSWAEGRLEKMPVPYLYPPARFGKAEGNSVYNQLFHPARGMFCRAGIIGERGGGGNDTGKLLIDNPAEMMEKIKALQETPTP
jgi:hypothetical protein